MSKTKKIPIRKCIICQAQDNKKNLIRVVKTKDGHVFIDPSKKANGRGAYLCANKDCIEKAIKEKKLERSFKMQIDPSLYDQLKAESEKK